MGKRIITLDDILAAAQAGDRSIPAAPEGQIITAQAREKAAELGLALPGEDAPDAPAAKDEEQVVRQVAEMVAAKAGTAMSSDEVRRVVGEVVAARLAGAKAAPVSPAASAPAAPVQGMDGQYTDAGGVFLVECERLFKDSPSGGAFVAEGVNCTCADLSGAIMQWGGESMPRTMERSEIAVVIEGELTLACNGAKLVGKPGDMLYLPAGAEVEYSSAGRVRLACVSAK